MVQRAVGLPFFSIIVPTRDRPDLLRRALSSIAVQSRLDYEVIVVDDGSSDPAGVAAVVCEFGGRFRVVRRAGEELRHGPNVARNCGIAHATGEYLCFLDDDDYWCNASHLELAKQSLLADGSADVYVADQIAKRNGTTVVPTWLPFLQQVLHLRQSLPGGVAWQIEHSDLLQPEGIGFVHVNICVVRRTLVQQVGGFWERAPYEGDLDFFLRLVDRAERLLYRPAVVSVMELRAGADSGGISSLDAESRQLLRLLVCQHAEMHCKRKDVRAYIRLLHAGVLKTMSKQYHASGETGLAASLAARATVVDPSFRWLFIAVYLRLCALCGR
jgi:glycosyltransferase involved in cell wall biosynthesis